MISEITTLDETFDIKKEFGENLYENSSKDFKQSKVETQLQSSNETNKTWSNNSTLEDSEEPITSEGYKTIDFESPAELVAFFDPFVNSGETILYNWQTETLEKFSSAKASGLHPYKFILCAANGSGKDAFIVAPFAIWHCLCKKRSLTIITSSSGVQLTAQTENYIRTLANRANLFYKELYGCEIFKINQRFIRCRLSGSEIRLFATDEEGKAEGYHPLEPGASFAIIINEAKSVSKEIYQALRRCTGFSYWIEVSTPGEPHGDFYKHFTYWPNKLRITFYDCPRHQSKEEFEAEKLELGESSYLFRSKWLALFTSVGGQVVITDEALSKCYERKSEIKWIGKDWPIRIGIDLSVGGDETVIQFVKGNKHIKQECFRITDATNVADRIEFELKEMSIPKNHEYIFLDDGGVGKGIIDILQRRGWINLNRVLNQSKARSKQGQFKNRGSEMWFKFSRLVQECIPILLDDEKLKTQLTSRHYKKSDGLGGITLLSKAQERAEGINSPDRADSLILAFCGVSLQDFLNAEETTKKVSNRKYLGKTVEEIENNYDNLDSVIKELKQKAAKGSLQVLLKLGERPKFDVPLIDQL